MTSLAIRIRSWPHTKSPDDVDLVVQVGTGGGPPKSRYATTLTHNERDYLNTFVEEVATTYMYGETPKDVVTAAASVKRLARAHEASTSP